MSEPRDPVRLFDAHDADPILRSALREVSQSQPDPAELTALVERVGAAATNAGGASWLAQLTTQSTGLKLAALVFTGGVALWSAWNATPAREPARAPAATAPRETEPRAPRAEPETRPAPARTSVAAARAAQAAGESDHGSLAAAEPAHVVLGASAQKERDERLGTKTVARGASHSARRAPVRAHTARASALIAQAEAARRQQDTLEAPRENERESESESELALISQAQRELASAPRRAIDLLDRHDALYPSGRFAEEREVLWIDALSQLGMERALRARAQRFLSSYPTSLHCARVRSLLDGTRSAR